MFERYTELARRALFYARYESSQRGVRSIETEHLLLGLIREGKGPVSRLLDDSHVTPAALLFAVDSRTTCGDRIPESVEIPFSREMQDCLSFTPQEADRLKHRHIGPEHLLLGLLRVDGSLAASILNGQGVTLEAARHLIATEPQSAALANDAAAGDSRLEAIKLLVEQLGRTEANTDEGRSLVARIHRLVDALRPPPLSA